MSHRPALRALALLALACALAALAQDAGTPLRALFPELKGLPAPAWAAEGVRLTYYSAAASVPANADQEEPGPGGHGFTQVDIVALDANVAVLSVRSLGLGTGLTPVAAPGPDNVYPIGTVAAVGLPASTGDWWLHPAVLKDAPRKARGDLKILKMPYTLGDREYRAVRFQYDTDNARFVSVFDLDTGILLHQNNRVGQEDGRKMLTQATFVSRRQVAYPWLASPVPGWLATVKLFRGRFTTTVSLPFNAPMTFGPGPVAGKVTARGPRWCAYDVTITPPTLPGLPAIPQTATLAAGIAQVGGLWLPPAGLAALTEDQLVDEDPVLRTRLTVTAADGNTVEFTEKGNAFTNVWTYRPAAGRLLASRLTKHTLATTDAVEITALE